jgi:sulfoxide reductase catalytic subunit YedY
MGRFDFPAEGLSREVTPRDLFLRRRSVLRLAAGLPLLGLVNRRADAAAGAAKDEPAFLVPPYRYPGTVHIERSDAFPLPADQPQRTTAERVAASHNNFYEFLSGRGGFVFPLTKDFVVEPWKVEVRGECHKPATFDLDALDRLGLEERLYAFRCVERWAMNVPWVGLPLARLLERVEPTSRAKYVSFVSAERPTQMPGLAETTDEFPWPYHEALRVDEATNPLTFLATGMYGHPLLKQNGAPVRIVLPWKYGYKGAKSVVSIELTEKRPSTFWSSGPYAHEYGFLSNVNPNIPHPRWDQDRSYWLGSDPKEIFPTPLFNGYAKWVGSLYPDEPTTPQKPLEEGRVAR